MFKKVIQSLSKSLSKQAEAPPAAPAKPAAKAAAKVAAPAPPAAARTPIIPQAAPAPAPAPAPVVVEVPKSADELCEVTSKMNKDQIRERLRLLYRRYNRAASSLNAATRAEAEKMLNAIVTVREKNFGEI
jgi:hypothetical protein